MRELKSGEQAYSRMGVKMTALEFLAEYVNALNRAGDENLAECRVFIANEDGDYIRYMRPEIDVKFGDIIISWE